MVGGVPLITTLEMPSPVNQPEPGLTAYRQKHQRLYQAKVRLVKRIHCDGAPAPWPNRPYGRCPTALPSPGPRLNPSRSSP